MLLVSVVWRKHSRKGGCAVAAYWWRLAANLALTVTWFWLWTMLLSSWFQSAAVHIKKEFFSSSVAQWGTMCVLLLFLAYLFVTFDVWKSLLITGLIKRACFWGWRKSWGGSAQCMLTLGSFWYWDIFSGYFQHTYNFFCVYCLFRFSARVILFKLKCKLIGTADFYHIIPLSMTLTLTGGHKVSKKQNVLGVTFSHTLIQNEIWCGAEAIQVEHADITFEWELLPQGK